jgi:hypothetical protein
MRPSSPRAPRLALQLALGLLPPFRLEQFPSGLGILLRGLPLLPNESPRQCKRLRFDWPASCSALPQYVRGRISVNVCLSQRPIFGHYGKVVPNAFPSLLIERPGLSLRADVTSAIGRLDEFEPDSQDRDGLGCRARFQTRSRPRPIDSDFRPY